MTSHLTLDKLSIQIANKMVCEQLELPIAAGELWGILGQNGSGKTTLLHTLAGLRPPQAGEIYLFDKKLSSYPARQRAKKVGLLFQSNQSIFPQTVWESCLAGRYPHFVSFLESALDKAATQAALKVLALEEQCQQNVLTLSGGEARRLALATLLAQDPAIYLLDEPLNHLDLQHQKRLLHTLRLQTQQKKISVLMTVHDINIAERYCDQILMLFGRGKTLAGAKADLLTEETLTALYEHPLRLVEKEGQRWWVAE